MYPSDVYLIISFLFFTSFIVVSLSLFLGSMVSTRIS